MQGSEKMTENLCRRSLSYVEEDLIEEFSKIVLSLEKIPKYTYGTEPNRI